MKWLKISIVVLAGGITAAVLPLLVYPLRRNGRLSDAIAQTRATASDWGAMCNQHAKLVAAAPAQAESIQQEQEEIARRKIEVDSLRVQLAALRHRPQRTTEERQAAIERTKAQAALIPVPPGMLTPEMLQNVGR